MIFPAKPQQGDRYYEPTGNFFERTWRTWQFTGQAWVVIN